MMAINKYKEHVLVLPEDDANHDIANGFLLNPELNVRQIQILTSAGGWKKAFEQFENYHIAKIRMFPVRRFIILIDLDNMSERAEDLIKKIPDDIKDRVFIIGALTEPEDLKRNTAYATFENIGKALARDCVNATNIIWGHDLLKHNNKELEKMVVDVKPFLFH